MARSAIDNETVEASPLLGLALVLAQIAERLVREETARETKAMPSIELDAGDNGGIAVATEPR